MAVCCDSDDFRRPSSLLLRGVKGERMSKRKSDQSAAVGREQSEMIHASAKAGGAHFGGDELDALAHVGLGLRQVLLDQRGPDELEDVGVVLAKLQLLWHDVCACDQRRAPLNRTRQTAAPLATLSRSGLPGPGGLGAAQIICRRAGTGLGRPGSGRREASRGPRQKFTEKGCPAAPSSPSRSPGSAAPASAAPASWTAGLRERRVGRGADRGTDARS